MLNVLKGLNGADSFFIIAVMFSLMVAMIKIWKE
jgi:hypothetical protein